MPGVEPGKRPPLDRHRPGDRLAERRSLEGIQARIGSDPDDLSIPLDEHVVDGAVVAVPLVELAALRRDEVRDDAWVLRVADVVALQAGVEMRIAGEVRIGLARGLDVRRVVRAETPALVAEGRVRRLATRGRNR